MKKMKKAFLACFLTVVLAVGGIVYAGAVNYELFVSALQDDSSNDQTIVLSGVPAFINAEMLEAAFEMQEKYGHPVSVCIAQIIAESGFGSYGDGLSGLAYNYKNLFGIKYSYNDIYASGSVNLSTGEQTAAGSSYNIVAGFAVYPNYTSCIKRRSALLNSSRYAEKVGAYLNQNDGKYTSMDAKNFAQGIKDGGWATDVSYVAKLVRLMDQYSLYQFDNMTWDKYKSGNSETVIVGDGVFCNPCPGVTYISSTFGYRAWDNSYHKGIDYAAPAGTPTYAAKEGTVTIAGWSNSAGNWVVIDHGNGFVTKYMHHTTLCVSAGDHVAKGQQIGTVGTTGYSSGNHLHFQLEIDGVAVNPELYM